MNKVICEYRITERKTLHMRLSKIELSDNETLSMLQRYNFESTYANKKLDEIQKDMDELQMQMEQKEYEEMNYTAICKKMYNYSIFELIQQVIGNIVTIVKNN